MNDAIDSEIVELPDIGSDEERYEEHDDDHNQVHNANEEQEDAVDIMEEMHGHSSNDELTADEEVDEEDVYDTVRVVFNNLFLSMSYTISIQQRRYQSESAIKLQSHLTPDKKSDGKNSLTSSVGNWLRKKTGRPASTREHTTYNTPRTRKTSSSEVEIDETSEYCTTDYEMEAVGDLR